MSQEPHDIVRPKMKNDRNLRLPLKMEDVFQREHYALIRCANSYFVDRLEFYNLIENFKNATAKHSSTMMRRSTSSGQYEPPRRVNSYASTEVSPPMQTATLGSPVFKRSPLT